MIDRKDTVHKSAPSSFTKHWVELMSLTLASLLSHSKSETFFLVRNFYIQSLDFVQMKFPKAEGEFKFLYFK